MKDVNKIKEKILRLRQMVPEKGASEQEALTALEKADKLMSEHGITEADLRAATASVDMRVGEHSYGMKTQHPCAKYCNKTVGEFCQVKTWYTDRSNGFGFNNDVDMYEFLIKMVHDSMERGWKEFLSNNRPTPGVSRHTEYWSFMLGFALTINAKIRELIEARKTVGTGLIVLKMSLVEQGLKDVNPDLKFSKPRPRSISTSSDAMDQGREAGSRINLNRPLAQRESTIKRIS